MSYQLFHPDTEILGQVILDFGQAINSDQFTLYFDRHGLSDIQPDQWYPAQKWLDVLNDIAEASTSMFDLVSIGIRQLELAVMPDEFLKMPLAQILAAMDEAYRMNYRGTDIGGISTEVLSDQHIVMTVRSFEPDDLWFGNIHGMVRRFAPQTAYSVTFDPSTPRNAPGKEVTIFHIKLG